MQSPNNISFRLSVPQLIHWGGLLLLLCLVVPGAHAVQQTPVTSAPASSQKNLTPPWGQLEYTTLHLEQPTESFPEVMPDPEPIEWAFENHSSADLENLFTRAGLSPQHKSLLLDKTKWKALTNGWKILPPIEVVRDLPVAARKTIYAVLRQSSINHYLQYPNRFAPDEFDKWLRECGLPPDKQQLIRQVSFRDQDSVYFADGLLLQWLCNNEEKKKFAHALSRTPTLLMKLHITPQTDVDALMRYWCRGRRGKAMTGFIEALGHVPNGTSVSISYFLSTFARMRLYTFPDITSNPMAHRKNCFYTALNFFNETPDYRFIDPELVVATLRKDYTVATNNFTLGDVLTLVDSANTIIHMCVYVADDVVYTKNGATPLAPWVLMKRTEMLKNYPSATGIIVYRKKGID